jgi:hypothetical protein
MSDFNACFISYRHPDDLNARKFVDVFLEVLTAQLSLNLPNARVFFDQDGLRFGDKLQKLALELCRSACLVILYGPRHFDPTHPYCTMEYLGMRQIEDRRRTQLVDYLARHSLIFPVVFRGSNSLPDEIKTNIYAQFDDVIAPSQFRTGERRRKIDALARQIYERWEELERAGVFVSDDCGQFRFPEDQVQPWLNTHIRRPRTPMPNR